MESTRFSPSCIHERKRLLTEKSKKINLKLNLNTRPQNEWLVLSSPNRANIINKPKQGNIEKITDNLKKVHISTSSSSKSNLDLFIDRFQHLHDLCATAKTHRDFEAIQL